MVQHNYKNYNTIHKPFHKPCWPADRRAYSKVSFCEFGFEDVRYPKAECVLAIGTLKCYPTILPTQNNTIHQSTREKHQLAANNNGVVEVDVDVEG